MTTTSPLHPAFEIAPQVLKTLLSPSMILSSDLLQQNLAEMIRIAGRPSRLWPHCKTHKIREIIRLAIAAGVTKHKCATIAEAEMLAETGAKEVFLAYQLVGPNMHRMAQLLTRFPTTHFAITLDDPQVAKQLDVVLANAAAPTKLGAFIDIDCGQHRTGISDPVAGAALARSIADSKHLQLRGLHAYDGHNHQTDTMERKQAVWGCWELVQQFRKAIAQQGLSVTAIVAGGTGSFPIWAGIDDPAIELSPGTPVLYDEGYRRQFPDLKFEPAAMLLTRVVSHPMPHRLTLDLGYKAIAADGPLPQRAYFPTLPDAQLVLHNEEHLVIETAAAEGISVGQELLAIPKHVCPTSALHKEVYVLSNHKIIGTWSVVARDRQLTI